MSMEELIHLQEVLSSGFNLLTKSKESATVDVQDVQSGSTGILFNTVFWFIFTLKRRV